MYETLNSLPNDKILDWPKLKALADDKVNETEKLKFVMGRVENKDRVSDHVDKYVNRVDFRKITYRLMSQYALERTKTVCSVCLNHLIQIFPQACRPSSALKLLKNCASLCYGVY